MYPELFHIGPLAIRSYGLMLTISFVVGVLYIKRQSARWDISFETLLNIAYIMIFGGVIGARISYVLLHLSDFKGNWSATFNPFTGPEFGIAGLNLYGGVLLAVAGTWLYCRFKKLSILEIFDLYAPTLGIGLALTRIGCFLNGCCFGTPTDLPWGVQFPTGSIPFYIYGDAHIHPAQLYSSLYGLGLFLLLHYMMKRRKFVGQLVAVLFMVEAVFRFIIEYVRYYEDAMYFDLGGLHPTFNQFVSLSLFLLGLGIYIIQSRRGPSTKES